MNTIKFWNIPDHIKSLKFNGNKSDFHLISDNSYHWGAKTKKNYIKAEKEINAIIFGGNGYQIYCNYDVSGFDFWMKKMEEPNHLYIKISFNSENILKSEINHIKIALNYIESQCELIEKNFSYDPSPCFNKKKI